MIEHSICFVDLNVEVIKFFKIIDSLFYNKLAHNAFVYACNSCKINTTT